MGGRQEVGVASWGRAMCWIADLGPTPSLLETLVQAVASDTEV